MGDKDQSDGNHTWRAATLQENQMCLGEATRSRADLRQVRNSLEDRFIRMRRGGNPREVGCVSNGLGTQMSQCWDGQITGRVDVFGESSGGQTGGHFGVTGNLSCFPTTVNTACQLPRLPSVSQSCLSRKKKTCFSAQPSSVFHPLFSSWRVYSQVKTFFQEVQ